MSSQPIHPDDFELRADQQRERLHQSVTELRSGVRRRLDPGRAARSYLWQASTAAGLLAMAAGYVLAGAFRRS